MRLSVSFFVASACVFSFASTSALADSQTWMASPASANWNTTELNWDSGAAWTQRNAAVFNASTVTNLTLTETITASGITVSSGDYSFAGEPFRLSTAAQTAGEQKDIPVEVAAGATATINNFVNMYNLDSIAKSGSGRLTLAGGYRGLQLISYGGDIHLTSGTVHTAKIYKNSTAAANLHLDNVTIETYNPNKIIGHPYRFNSATIGEHGFTIMTHDHAAELHQCFSTAPGLAADGGIVKTGDKPLTINPKNGEKSTFTGGVTVNAGELIVENTDGLGAGPVVVKSGAGVALTNTAVLQSHTYQLDNGGAFGAILQNYTVNRPGELPAFTASNFRNVLTLGRIDSQTSVLTLLPTNNFRLGAVSLCGVLDFTFGGTLKISEMVGDSFFRTTSLKSGSATRVATADGLTVDVPANTATDLGLPFNARSYSATLTSTTVDDFESNADGWSINSNGCPDGNGTRAKNGVSYITDSNYYTPSGDYFIYLRRRNYMQKSITVPEAGNWRVAFLSGCRNGYNSYALTITVTFGDNSHTIPARVANHGFIEFATPAYALEAGAKTVRITLGDGDQWTGMGIDCVRLEKVEDAYTPFTKSGTGELAVSDFTTKGTVTVSAGTLTLKDAALTNAQVSVAAGATLELRHTELNGARVTVPAGAAIAFRGADVIKNGSFETYSASSATTWRFSCENWNVSRVTPSRSANDSGGQNNGSAVSSGSGAYLTPYGRTTAYIRSQYQMAQTVTVPTAGDYVLSFVHSQRVYPLDPSYLNPISVTIDGTEVVNIPARTTNIDYTRVTSAPITLTAGSHSLAFKNLGTVGNPDGAMVFIDDVSLSQSTVDLAFANNGRIDLVTGSIVRLGNAAKLELPQGSVYVDGQPFVGTRNTLRAKGIIVEGDGKIQVGPPLGLCILIK